MKAYLVTSDEWHSTVEIDDEIFDTHESRCQEAIAQSIEKWTISHDNHSTFAELVGDDDMSWISLNREFCAAHDCSHKDNEEDWVMTTESVFENIGRLDLLRQLAEFNDSMDASEEDL